jgi:phosphoserine phosphatase RsbU/P
MLVILAIGAVRRDVSARLLLLPVFLIQGLYIAGNLIIALNQFGFPIEARILDTPFITVPFTMHPALLADLLFVLAMLGFLIRRFTIARRREERWEGAIEAARQIQKLLLPEAIPQVKGFTIDCIYRPAEVVGGDFFQILPTPEGGLLIVVGDVAGKGLPAAMMVSMIVGAIRAEAAYNRDPAKLAESLNQRLIGRMEDKNGAEAGSGFTTCLCAHLAVDGALTMANAGHLPPYRNGEEMPLPGALPLGMLAGIAYETVTFKLAPGDRLTFVSDGVVEAQNKAGELWGFDRTQALSTHSAAKITETSSNFGQVDDITVVTIEFHGVSVARSSDLESDSDSGASDLASSAQAV